MTNTERVPIAHNSAPTLCICYQCPRSIHLKPGCAHLRQYLIGIIGVGCGRARACGSLAAGGVVAWPKYLVCADCAGRSSKYDAPMRKAKPVSLRMWVTPPVLRVRGYV